MPYFDNDGIKLYYEIEGKGPPVVMIHGFLSNIEESWKETNEILADSALVKAIRNGEKELAEGKGVPWEEAKKQLNI